MSALSHYVRKSATQSSCFSCCVTVGYVTQGRRRLCAARATPMPSQRMFVVDRGTNLRHLAFARLTCMRQCVCVSSWTSGKDGVQAERKCLRRIATTEPTRAGIHAVQLGSSNCTVGEREICHVRQLAHAHAHLIVGSSSVAYIVPMLGMSESHSLRSQNTTNRTRLVLEYRITYTIFSVGVNKIDTLSSVTLHTILDSLHLSFMLSPVH